MFLEGREALFSLGFPDGGRGSGPLLWFGFVDGRGGKLLSWDFLVGGGGGDLEGMVAGIDAAFMDYFFLVSRGVPYAQVVQKGNWRHFYSHKIKCLRALAGCLCQQMHVDVAELEMCSRYTNGILAEEGACYQ